MSGTGNSSRSRKTRQTQWLEARRIPFFSTPSAQAEEKNQRRQGNALQPIKALKNAVSISIPRFLPAAFSVLQFRFRQVHCS
jgi:hypothetical protein